jgi:hypothetical protein
MKTVVRFGDVAQDFRDIGLYCSFALNEHGLREAADKIRRQLIGVVAEQNRTDALRAARDKHPADFAVDDRVGKNVVRRRSRSHLRIGVQCAGFDHEVHCRSSFSLHDRNYRPCNASKLRSLFSNRRFILGTLRKIKMLV